MHYKFLDLPAKLGKIFFASKLFATFLHFRFTFGYRPVRRQPGADPPEQLGNIKGEK